MPTNQHDDDAPRRIEDVLTDLEQLLDELTRPADSDHVATTRLIDASARLRTAGARLDAVRWTILPKIEAAGLWAQSGARNFSVWLARTEDVQTLTARREVRTAKTLRDHLPATLTAALAGRVSTDKIRALVDVATTSTTRINALAAPAIDLATMDLATIDAPTSAPTNGDAVETKSGDTEQATDSTAPAAGLDADAGVDAAKAGAGAGDDAPTEPARPTEPTGPTWEEQLLDWSTQNGPDRFRGLVRYFARHADPDADERGYTKAKEREHLDVSPTLDGYHLNGFLTEEHGLALTTALGSVMGAPAAGEDRTPGQRRAQALADLTRIALDNAHTGTGAAVRPHLNVTVSWTELQALATKNTITTNNTINNTPAGTGSTLFNNTTCTDTTCTNTTCTDSTSATAGPRATRGTGIPSVKRPAVFTDTNTPVPVSLLRRIACDSQTTRIIFGPDSQVLDVGRTQRTITGHLRRAVIARDRHCVYDGCDQPPSRCEVHHAIRHWADGGETSVSNAALLCWHHHDLVDSRGITMRYDDGWHFTHPNGQRLGQ